MADVGTNSPPPRSPAAATTDAVPSRTLHVGGTSSPERRNSVGKKANADQEADGAPLLFYRAQCPPSQLLGYIEALEESYEDLLAVRSRPAPSDAQTGAVFAQTDTSQDDELEVEKLLSAKHIGQWNYDLFRLWQLVGDRVLSRLGMALMDHFSLVETLALDRRKLQSTLETIEQGYNACVYHNRLHAADVMHGVFCLLLEADLFKKLSADELFAALLAAAAHDVAHPGVNNAFMVEGAYPVAARMRNDSVLEKFHAGLCLYILDLTGVVAHLPPARQHWIQHVMTQSIALTDMSLHFNLLNQLDKQPARLVDKVIQTITHAADLSNVSKIWPIHIQWSHAVIVEFFCQGDLETRLQRKVSAHCVRNETEARISQKNFVTKFAAPLYEKMGSKIPELGPLCQRLLNQMTCNVQRWKELGY